MQENQTCRDSKVKDTIKFGILIILAIVIFIYAVMLFTGRLGKQPVKPPQKSTNPAEIQAAETTIDTLLAKNTYGFVKGVQETPKFFEVKVAKDDWKKQTLQEKKTFIQSLAHARGILGLNNNIKIKDDKTKIEMGRFENNRVSLAELEF